MQGPFACLVLSLASAAVSAHEPTYTQFHGQLLKAGRPLAHATIETCADVDSRGAAVCKRPMRLLTGQDGRFTFIQATGYPPCTVCPCATGTSSPTFQVLPINLSCDPSRSFWFKVIAGADSAEYDWWSLGYGIEGAINLTCDVRRPASEVGAPGAVPRDRFHLPRLHCVVNAGT
jgi:hypothetical protein